LALGDPSTLEGLKKHLTAYEKKLKTESTAGCPELAATYNIIETALYNGLDHLEKYTGIVFQIPVYLAGVVLDPKWKWEFLEGMAKRNHPRDFKKQLDKAKARVQNLWDTQYKVEVFPHNQQSIIPKGPVEMDFLYSLMFDAAAEPASDGPEELENSVRQGSARKTRTKKNHSTASDTQRIVPTIQDEYERWNLEPKDLGAFDLLAYCKLKRASYPHLSVMALEILAIPAMSAEVERVFSSAKQTITARRARLKVEIVEALECLRHWDAAGIIKTWEV
jgi:hypothetical protein